MRQILYFPIIHNQADFGSLKDKMLKQGEQNYGKQKWRRHIRYVRRVWGLIEDFISQYIETKGVLHSNIRIYQDGLPITGEHGLKIVREIAKRGSRNHQILEKLVNQGACLEKAENNDLLLQEYGYLSRIVRAATPIEKLKEYILYEEAAQGLLERRDKYIAERINATLKQKELGLAFFGAAHSILDKLAEDIRAAIIQKFNDRISKELIIKAKGVCNE